jgi:geranylgeranyl diphosphate synthase type II
MRKMRQKSYSDEIKEYIGIINSRLLELCTGSEYSCSLLYESMRYSLFAGGKRIRPLLSIAACRLLGADPLKYLNYACAIEMIHTYSLIHDDLPSIDNDDFRRGVPTNHKKYGEGMAVFAGDALLNKAASIMAKDNAGSDRPGIAASCMEFILGSSGADGMLAGQAIDISNKDPGMDIDALKLMHSLKTGKLIKAALCFPAILEERPDTGRILSDIAVSAGLAFQIKDDILDVEGSFSELGKETGRDIKQNKITYVSLLGINEAKRLLQTEIEKALFYIKKFEKNGDFLKHLIMMISGKTD